MRGGIAEKGGVRVGHRIIEINSKIFQFTRTETSSRPNNSLSSPQLEPIPNLTVTYPRLILNLTLT